MSVCKMSTIFAHTSLNLSCRQIRLMRLCDDHHDELELEDSRHLEVHGSKEKDVGDEVEGIEGEEAGEHEQDERANVACEIRHFSLDSDDMPAYHALSYTWGPPQPAHIITIDGGNFHVRANLHNFLVEAQRRSFQNWIWIDQICIAQENTSERNHQVSMMADIYRGAARVVIWLGDPVREHGIAASLLANFVDHLVCMGELIDCGRVSHHQAWPHMEKVMLLLQSNIYWARVWITQEIKLNPANEIWWGAELMCTAHVAHRAASYTQWDSSCIRIQALLDPSREPESLTQVLKSMSVCLCEEPRDHVYALQAILRPSSVVIIDYGKPIETVFKDALAIILEECWSLESFSYRLGARVVRALRERMMPGSDCCLELVGTEFRTFFREFYKELHLERGCTFTASDAACLIEDFCGKLHRSKYHAENIDTLHPGIRSDFTFGSIPEQTDTKHQAQFTRMFRRLYLKWNRGRT